MDFEWDEAKNEQNLRQRKLGFDEAARIFDGPFLETTDTRKAYGETRVQAIGLVNEEILFVTYTDRNGIRRIISARKANKKERLLWQSSVNP